MQSNAVVIKQSTRRRKFYWTPWLFIAPFVISFFVFFIVPAIYSLVLSLYQYRGYGVAKFVGFRNYRALLQYSYFWSTLKNIGFYYVAHLIPQMGLSFFIALAITSSHSRFKNAYKGFIFLPQIMAVVCTSLVFRIMLSTRSGLAAQWFEVEIPFLTNPQLARWSVVGMIVWRNVGWYMIVFLAGLTNINSDVLQAAIVDGASGRQRLVYIIIPLMKPTFMMALIVDAISSLKLSVEPNMLLSGWLNAPEYAAPVMNVLLSNIKGGNYGMASAAGWILFVIIFIFSIIQFFTMEDKEA